MKLTEKAWRTRAIGEPMGLALALVLSSTVHGQTMTWTTDDFQLAPGLGAQSAQGHAWGSNQNGVLFNLGSAQTASGATPAVLRTQSVSSSGIQDLGFSEFLLPGGTSGDWRNLVAGPTGNTQNLFLGGCSTDAQGLHWMVNTSADGGATWSILNEYQYAPGLNAFCDGLAMDAGTTLYAVGSAITRNNNGSRAWMIRKGSLGINGQWTWTVVDSVPQGAAYSIVIRPGSPQSTIFVAGTQNGLVQNSYKPTTWVTRCSTNGGATWATADTFPTTENSFAMSTALDTKGNVTVAGFGLNSGGQGMLWTVRQTMDGGKTWATIDSTVGRAFGVTTVPRTDGLALPDDVYVSGDQTITSGSTSQTWWIVRKLTASITSQGAIIWTPIIVDQFQFVPGQPSSAQGGLIYVPSSAALLTTGSGSDGTAEHWITRSTVVQ